MNFRGRGRGDFNNQSRGGGNFRQFSNGNARTSDNYHKPAGADANGNKKKKKRRTNTLGLTPNGAEHEDSEDEVDDVDEEARLVTLLGPDCPTYVITHLLPYRTTHDMSKIKNPSALLTRN